MIKVLVVGLGGFLGAITRFLIVSGMQRMIPAASLPLGTMAANLIGCLLMGVVLGISESRNLLSQELSLFIVVGFLGSLTTFSAFGNDALVQFRQQQMGYALAYIGISVVAGILLIQLGLTLARMMESV